MDLAPFCARLDLSTVCVFLRGLLDNAGVVLWISCQAYLEHVLASTKDAGEMQHTCRMLQFS